MEALERKVIQAEAAKSAHDSGVVRNNAADDASRAEAKRLEEELAAADAARKRETKQLEEQVMAEDEAAQRELRRWEEERAPADAAARAEVTRLEAELAAAKRADAVADAAQADAAKLAKELAAAKLKDGACTSEVSKLRTMYADWTALQKNPSLKAKVGVTALLPQLKLMGVEKKVTDGLPAIIAKKKPTQPDKKLLSSVDEKFVAYVQCRAELLDKGKAEVQRCEKAMAVAAKSRAAVLDKTKERMKQCQDALAVASAAVEARAREFAGLAASASAAKEARRSKFAGLAAVASLAGEVEAADFAGRVAAALAPIEERARELGGLAESLKTAEAERRSCEEDFNSATNDLSAHEEKMRREGFLRFSSSAQVCAVCCDDAPAGSAVLLGCSHGWYCLECVNRFVEARLDTGTAGDVPCPDCKTTISEEDLVSLLPKKTIFRLHARTIEKEAVAGGANCRACPTPDCKMRQTIPEGASGQVQCLMCDKESCFLCGTQPYHEGVNCQQHAERKRIRGEDKDMDELYKWMEATGTRQCPTCQMATTTENLAKQTEQRSECHKMLCRNCGTRFCFKCLAVLTDTFSCGCSKNKHGFVDPRTGEVLGHLKRGKPKVEKEQQVEEAPKEVKGGRGAKVEKKRKHPSPNSGGC